MTVDIMWSFKKWSLPIQKTYAKCFSEAYSRPSEIFKIDVLQKIKKEVIKESEVYNGL